MEMNFASKGVAGAGLGLGIAGTALGILNNGGLSNIFSGVGGNAVCSDNVAVNRYELGLQNTITNKDMEIAYLKGRDAAKTDSLELYKYVDGRFRAIEAQIGTQAVVNAQVAANLGCLQSTVANLASLTKTVIPIGNVCPEPMPAYNSWTAPTTGTTTG